ncbi:GL18677 [Drosophila persimilis]|uniref:GL18677 n=1 Tax=Drosophila persimilis TaxID=7234 RepID=B4G9B8_DROPE|nr:GL18677 [Drosophila persimilis]
MRRPDSYYTAREKQQGAPHHTTRTPRPLAQPPAAPTAQARPKTVYQTASEESSPTTPSPLAVTNSYHRSKSEALLETDFDHDDGSGGLQPLQTNGRSHSQPLETAM